MPGKCKRRAVRFGKWAARVLGTAVGPRIPVYVELAEQTAKALKAQLPELVFGGHEKRRLVWDLVQSEAKRVGHDVFDDAKAVTLAELETATRAAIEAAVFQMKTGGDKLVELTDWDPGDLDDAPDD